MPADRRGYQYRVRVFDRAGPWRASQGEAVRDAVETGNASFDGEIYCRTFMTAPAWIERYPR